MTQQTLTLTELQGGINRLFQSRLNPRLHNQPVDNNFDIMHLRFQELRGVCHIHELSIHLRPHIAIFDNSRKNLVVQTGPLTNNWGQHQQLLTLKRFERLLNDYGSRL
jgi:hypothetical protein